ncbi:uncharacterized protein LOC143911282 [Arctopsyche grandis]|uniref:uncharacterized protein LOC143911282 n=1 Tax=Arctopsyche grandis TaxID=121162 RepID=UPI00406D93B9
MSSEAERGGDPQVKKAENGGHQRQSPTSYVKEHWSTALKIIELLFAIFCIGLIVDPVNYGRLQNNLHHIAMIFTAFGGYMIVNSVLILGRLSGERIGWKTSVTFSLVGAVVFTAAGGVIISDWTKYMYNHVYHPSKHYMDMMISSGVFAIFSAAIYVVDAILTYREEP